MILPDLPQPAPTGHRAARPADGAALLPLSRNTDFHVMFAGTKSVAPRLPDDGDVAHPAPDREGAAPEMGDTPELPDALEDAGAPADPSAPGIEKAPARGGSGASVESDPALPARAAPSVSPATTVSPPVEGDAVAPPSAPPAPGASDPSVHDTGVRPGAGHRPPEKADAWSMPAVHPDMTRPVAPGQDTPAVTADPHDAAPPGERPLPGIASSAAPAHGAVWAKASRVADAASGAMPPAPVVTVGGAAQVPDHPVLPPGGRMLQPTAHAPQSAPGNTDPDPRAHAAPNGPKTASSAIPPRPVANAPQAAPAIPRPSAEALHVQGADAPQAIATASGNPPSRPGATMPGPRFPAPATPPAPIMDTRAKAPVSDHQVFVSDTAQNPDSPRAPNDSAALSRAAPDGPARSDLPRHVAAQIAAAVQRAAPGEQTMELTLNPAELGRVRISMAPGDGTIVVTVLAERPETLDLMRRHADLLARDFHDLGYESAEFSFGQNGADTGQQPGDAPPQSGPLAEPAPASPAPGCPLWIAADRVDIRL